MIHITLEWWQFGLILFTAFTLHPVTTIVTEIMERK